MAVWTSFREYVAVVVKQWWFYVGVASGILALIGLFRPVPPFPWWLSVSAFVLFLSAAQFAAFHQLRFQRDEGDQAGLTLLAQAPGWHLGGVAYTYDQHGTTLLATPEAFASNPEVRLDFVTDIEMEAHGGAKGGVLFGLTWTIHNLPGAATFEAPVVVMPITLAAGEGDPLRPRLSIQLDKVRLADLRRVWEELPGDPVLTAGYHVKGRSAAVETRLTLPRSRLLAAIAPWRKMVGLPPETDG
jgi:hypothetical protein